ncbi:MAG TPA: DUF308 domain-containing protein [Bradyrhizobium sp.]|nr:DUF308 domain-containing protein [Bradyrhizobium sp.]
MLFDWQISSERLVSTSMSKRGKELGDLLDEAEVLLEGVEHAARSHWPILLTEGIALIVFGVFALFISPLMSFGIVAALGWVFFFGGMATIIACFRQYPPMGFTYLLLPAIMAVFAGIALLVKPWSAAISLTVILIVCFAFLGAAKLTYPLERSRYLPRYRALIRASGVFDIVLAGLMFFDLPDTALWAPGLLLGANMVLGGIALVTIALLERRKASREPG